MKKCFLIMLLFLLLTGCCFTDPETTTTVPSAEPSSVPASVGTIGEIQDVEQVWVPRPYCSIPYGEYLSEGRVPFSIGGNCWVGTDGESEFFLDANAEGFCVRSYDSTAGLKNHWTVPGTEDWQSDDILLCDGIWAYGVRRETELFRIELLTGKEDVLFTADRMMCGRISANGNVGNGKNLLLIDHDWLYFLAKKEDRIGLYRLHIPTMKLDLLHNAIPGDTLPHALILVIPENTARIDVIYMDSEVQELVLTHFQNSDSPYNGTHPVDVFLPFEEEPERCEIDFSMIWGQTDYETWMLWDPRFDFISILIQNDNNKPAKRLCSYNTLIGQVTDTPIWAKACDNINTIMKQISDHY